MKRMRNLRLFDLQGNQRLFEWMALLLGFVFVVSVWSIEVLMAV